MKKRVDVRVYTSFEDENKAEHRRLARMSPQERMQEFATLQARMWGEQWTTTPMVKQAAWEWPSDEVQ